jgi:hypothetical protein
MARLRFSWCHVEMEMEEVVLGGGELELELFRDAKESCYDA